eukprot:gene14484-17088_t
MLLESIVVLIYSVVFIALDPICQLLFKPYKDISENDKLVWRMRWFLLTSKQKKSVAYVINGVIMALGFLTVRALFCPVTTLILVFRSLDVLFSLSPSIFVVIALIASWFALTALNYYWTFLIWKALVNAMMKPKKVKENFDMKEYIPVEQNMLSKSA